MLNGKQEWFYASGKLKAQLTFKDNLGIGKATAYYENGNLYAEVNFKGGNLKGGIKYNEEGVSKKVTSFASEMDKFLLD
jgi:antitoxin component YwqK of YwqJK toxin-antitoxin module